MAKQTVKTTKKRTITINPKSTSNKRCPNCGKFMKKS